MTKIILIIADGLGDRPIQEFGYKTPLESANKPILNQMAKEGITGLMHTIERGMRPGSDTAHLLIFGYPYKEYYSGRGVFEVLGIGMDLRPGDVAFRGNLATVENGIITDRRAGSMESYEVIPETMTVQIGDVTFILKPSVLHRVGVIMRGKGITSNILDLDPHKVGVAPRKKIAIESDIDSKRTEDILNKFSDYMADYLSKHPANLKRKSEGKPNSNYLLLRGAGQHMYVQPIHEKYNLRTCCIAGGGLYKGLAKYVGMDIIDVPGANARINTDLNAKIKAAIEQSKKYDLVFVHIKFADSLAEVGDFQDKKDFLEKIDSSLAPLLETKDTIVFFSGDHSTPCKMQAHSGDPVPSLIWGPPEMICTDKVKEFGERPCQGGGLGHFNGLDIIQNLLNLSGKQKLIGA
ncbi:MAG: 2,3-bisphosphoglycerate-independent phosphoglycerate mutase [Nanoarchaeota archaeon]|nr:2,3-bisphosphoglycerate-independent phosphoglycerate mutase [Nanoarchaeota archaeon]MBU1004524.1 2,3-bisphosphoglycerate-independent phosphoglycerate mutase [Nanoarchaeota archaeon]MBU1945939.1 2,3-bisphosphoglycerate-independent phosphoglycerate mutase [Nanoarchaeota archaeon]